MCAGAIVLARIKRLVYGADDPKAGAAGSIFNIVDHPALNHQTEVHAGTMADAAAGLLREFFGTRRG
jgi:tRNA(adenine34) deaminase